jgi:uncharacterized protein
MPATLRHFAINADDVDRARGFYEAVFGWSYTPWGPPGFFQTRDAGDGVLGALQKRHDMTEGKSINSFVTTFAVDDIRATLAAVEANGGRVAMQPFMIDGVGEIGYFVDCEGNFTGVGQYVEGHWG